MKQLRRTSSDNEHLQQTTDELRKRVQQVSKSHYSISHYIHILCFLIIMFILVGKGK